MALVDTTSNYWTDGTVRHVTRLLVDEDVPTGQFQPESDPALLDSSLKVFPHCFCLTEAQENLFQYLLAIPIRESFYHFDETIARQLWRAIVMADPCTTTTTTTDTESSDTNQDKTDGKAFDLIVALATGDEGAQLEAITQYVPDWVNSLIPISPEFISDVKTVVGIAQIAITVVPYLI